MFTQEGLTESIIFATASTQVHAVNREFAKSIGYTPKYRLYAIVAVPDTMFKHNVTVEISRMLHCNLSVWITCGTMDSVVAVAPIHPSA